MTDGRTDVRTDPNYRKASLLKIVHNIMKMKLAKHTDFFIDLLDRTNHESYTDKFSYILNKMLQTDVIIIEKL